MPFELIMLLGFFGTALLGLLPATPARMADESFRGRRQQRRRDGERRGGTGHGRKPERAAVRSTTTPDARVVVLRDYRTKWLSS